MRRGFSARRGALAQGPVDEFGNDRVQGGLECAEGTRGVAACCRGFRVERMRGEHAIGGVVEQAGLEADRRLRLAVADLELEVAQRDGERIVRTQAGCGTADAEDA